MNPRVVRRPDDAFDVHANVGAQLLLGAPLLAGPLRRLAGRPHRRHRRLDDLAEFGYLETEDQLDDGESRVWLTVEGFDLAKITEEVLLESLDVGARTPSPTGARGVPADGSDQSP